MAIEITAKKAGFRRAGVAHPDTPTVYAKDHFSEDELAQLKAEPMLVVSEVPDGALAAEGGPTSDGDPGPNGEPEVSAAAKRAAAKK